MLGHSSARLTLDTYAHMFSEAELGAEAPMVEAIEAARAGVARSDVYPECNAGPETRDAA